MRMATRVPRVRRSVPAFGKPSQRHWRTLQKEELALGEKDPAESSKLVRDNDLSALTVSNPVQIKQAASLESGSRARRYPCR